MKNIIHKASLALLLSFIFIGTTHAQFNTCDADGLTLTGQSCVNTIVTAVPFLRIAPDARSGGMGDVGIAISPDANSMHFNSSKLVFADKKFGVSANYTPWLRALDVNDVYLGYLSGYAKIGDMQAVGVSFRYFSLGKLYTNPYGTPIANNPREYELSASYNRKLTDKFAAGLTMKYIYSRLANPNANLVLIAGKSIASDLSFTYKTQLSDALDLTAGAAIRNLGSKISYVENSNQKDYIPTNLGIGSMLKWNINDNHRLHFALDINRLLVPTPPAGDPYSPENNNSGDPAIPDYKEKSLLAAAFGSFSDAPGGFGEEMRENNFSLGVEYEYKRFSARIGHFNEHKTKGGRKYLTVGGGVEYKIARLNLSYLVPTTNQRNPLDHTLRLSLLFNFGPSQG